MCVYSTITYISVCQNLGSWPCIMYHLLCGLKLFHVMIFWSRTFMTHQQQKHLLQFGNHVFVIFEALFVCFSPVVSVLAGELWFDFFSPFVLHFCNHLISLVCSLWSTLVSFSILPISLQRKRRKYQKGKSAEIHLLTSIHCTEKLQFELWIKSPFGFGQP